MRIIFTVFLVTTAVATGLQPPKFNDDHHLRGANTKVNVDRHLFTQDGRTSLSFSFASSAASDQLCFDYNAACLELGNLFSSSDTAAETGDVTAFAMAYAEEHLWLEATCKAYAVAYSQVCAFTKVDGQVLVDARMEKRKRNVSMQVALNTATTTFAMAKSVAVAEAYAAIDAKSFTSISAFCLEVDNVSPLCANGTASTDLTLIAQAKANSAGQGFAVSMSGSSTSSLASVQTRGNGIEYVNGTIVAYAKSWSFARAEATAKAFADAINSVASKSFAEICIARHGEICSSQSNNSGRRTENSNNGTENPGNGTENPGNGTKSMGEGICSLPADQACTNALATGEAYAKALSAACVKAFINAYAEAETLVFLSASVDSKTTPKLTWACTDAGVGQSCVV